MYVYYYIIDCKIRLFGEKGSLVNVQCKNIGKLDFFLLGKLRLSLNYMINGKLRGLINVLYDSFLIINV